MRCQPLWTTPAPACGQPRTVADSLWTTRRFRSSARVVRAPVGTVGSGAAFPSDPASATYRAVVAMVTPAGIVPRGLRRVGGAEYRSVRVPGKLGSPGVWRPAAHGWTTERTRTGRAEWTRMTGTRTPRGGWTGREGRVRQRGPVVAVIQVLPGVRVFPEARFFPLLQVVPAVHMIPVALDRMVPEPRPDLNPLPDLIPRPEPMWPEPMSRPEPGSGLWEPARVTVGRPWWSGRGPGATGKTGVTR